MSWEERQKELLEKYELTDQLNENGKTALAKMRKSEVTYQQLEQSLTQAQSCIQELEADLNFKEAQLKTVRDQRTDAMNMVDELESKLSVSEARLKKCKEQRNREFPVDDSIQGRRFAKYIEDYDAELSQITASTLKGDE